MRYAWNNYFQYINDSNLRGGIKGLLAMRTLQRLRSWDYQTANRPDYFIANSNYIAKQIKKRYNRDATVIYPPVDTHKFEVNDRKEDFYLTISRMVPYKRIDLIVNAFSKMKDKKLVVIGDGPLKKQLMKSAGSNIEFIEPVPFETLKEYLEKAKGFISAAEEDFGITVVEAMASGTPVIAFNRGGTGESVIDNKTGILFQEQSSESLIEGINKFERRIDSFDVHSIKDYSNKFNRNCFEIKIKEFIAEKMIDFNN
jgi:glycosyltransferase involved in cell wall biosynthesis